MLLLEHAQLHFPVFCKRDGVVVIYDGNGVLLGSPKKQALQMRPLFRVVEMLVLYQHLADGIFWIDETPIVFHQNGLPLRGIVGFYIVHRAFQLMAVAAQIIQAANFRCAGRDPDHSGCRGGLAGKRYCSLYRDLLGGSGP